METLRIDITVVVPTYNRAEFLKKSLKTFTEQAFDFYKYEILVIDNASTDHTSDVVRDISQNTDVLIKYFYEPNQGLHYARNRGIIESTGDIIIFGDDDIEASENWLKEIFEEFSLNHKTGIVGGKILPIWEELPPEWIYDYGTREVHPVFAFLDLGNQRKKIENLLAFGCNFGIRRSLVLEIGGSPPDTFPSSLMHFSGTGETDMIRQVTALGYDVVYLPKALVHHHVSANRVTFDYILERYRRWAVEDVFSVIRKKNEESRYRLLFRMLRASLYRHLKLLKEKQTGINPDLIRKVYLNKNRAKIKQIIRLLFDGKLYRSILKKNYLLNLQHQSEIG